MKVCSCCEINESNEMVSTSQDLCLECAKANDSVCTNCGSCLDKWQLDKWSPTNRIQGLCDLCQKNVQKNNDKHDWLEKTILSIESICQEHQWELSNWQTAQTGSKYAEIYKECDSCILGLDKDCDCKSIKIRVSDHATAYCREDFSISLNGSGDDHTLNDLENFLKNG